MIAICILFESGKRSKLKQSYILSKTEEKKNLQISELLRLFDDGLIIFDQNHNIQYKNEIVNKIINLESNSLIDELKKKKFQDGRLIFDSINIIKFDSNLNSISLGISEIHEFLYE